MTDVEREEFQSHGGQVPTDSHGWFLNITSTGYCNNSPGLFMQGTMCRIVQQLYMKRKGVAKVR